MTEVVTAGSIGNAIPDQRPVVQSFFETTGGPPAAPTVLNTAGRSPIR